MEQDRPVHPGHREGGSCLQGTSLILEPLSSPETLQSGSSPNTRSRAQRCQDPKKAFSLHFCFPKYSTGSAWPPLLPPRCCRPECPPFGTLCDTTTSNLRPRLSTCLPRLPLYPVQTTPPRGSGDAPQRHSPPQPSQKPDHTPRPPPRPSARRARCSRVPAPLGPSPPAPPSPTSSDPFRQPPLPPPAGSDPAPPTRRRPLGTLRSAPSPALRVSGSAPRSSGLPAAAPPPQPLYHWTRWRTRAGAPGPAAAPSPR